MMEVKVECSCGQRYKFDVEPVSGRMPGPVSCPVCGTDGTVAANAIIQQRLAAGSTAGSPPRTTAQVRLVAPTPAAMPSLRIAAAGPQSGAAHPPVETAVATTPLPLPVAETGRPAGPAARALALPAAGVTKAKGKFSHGVLGAVLGTLLGAGIWLGLFYTTEWGSRSLMKLFALVVGFSAGMGARLLSRDEGSKDLGYIAAAIAFAGIFAAQYIIAREQIIGGYKRVVGKVYEARLAYAKKVVKAVPTGSDKEIREFLAAQSTEDGAAAKPSEVSAEDVQEFRDRDLPELRDLASGKITKAQYNKDSGAEELEENSGVKLLIAIKGIGLFSFGAMILALGTAFKTAATDA